MGDPKRRGKKNIKTEQLILYNYSWEKYLIRNVLTKNLEEIEQGRRDFRF